MKRRLAALLLVGCVFRLLAGLASNPDLDIVPTELRAPVQAGAALRVELPATIRWEG